MWCHTSSWIHSGHFFVFSTQDQMSEYKEYNFNIITKSIIWINLTKMGCFVLGKIDQLKWNKIVLLCYASTCCTTSHQHSSCSNTECVTEHDMKNRQISRILMAHTCAQSHPHTNTLYTLLSLHYNTNTLPPTLDRTC